MPNQRERIVACAAACYVLMSGDYLSKKKTQKTVVDEFIQ